MPTLLQPAGDMLTHIIRPGGGGFVSSADTVFLGIDANGVPYFAVEVDSSNESLEAVAALGAASTSALGERVGYGMRACGELLPAPPH